MALFTIEGIAVIISSEQTYGVTNREIDKICIDSRACEERSLFVGLVGEKANGADYIEEAFKNGALGAIISQPQAMAQAIAYQKCADAYNRTLFFVESPLKALQLLAEHHVKRFPKLIKIAITGSNGKTTVKEMLSAILSEQAPTISTVGNLNSESGLPLSCFTITAKHRYAVMEMGMNRLHEIEELATIFKPHYAIITNIGTAHIGKLGSAEAIAQEKKCIASQFTGTQTLFIPQNDDFAAFLAKNINGKVLFYAPTLLKKFKKVEDLGLDGYKIFVDNEVIRLYFTGRHNLINACLAIYVANELGLKTALIKQGLAKCWPLSGRNEIIYGRVTVFKDCYNANLESMKASLQAIKGLKYARKVVFLAEMLELGDESRALHEALADDIISAQIDAAFLLGSDMIYLANELKEKAFDGLISYSHSFNNVAKELIAYLKDGDLLLLKGSRFHALERFLPLLEQTELNSTVKEEC